MAGSEGAPEFTQEQAGEAGKGRVGAPEGGRTYFLEQPWNTGGDSLTFSLPGAPAASGALCSMSLNAWEWEEDPASIEPISSITSFYQSTSECDVEEHLKAKARARESDSDRQCSSTESSSEPASTFSSDVPHVVPCTFTISLAFPVNTGRC